MADRPVIVGLVGGVAAGKSTVAKWFGRKGARVIDADALAHEALAAPAVEARVREIFGDEAYDGPGRPNRRRIAGEAFRDPAKLRALEAAVHPVVRRRMEEEIAAAGDAPAIVIDAPLLVEGGLAGLADVLVFVDAPAELRQARAMRDRGWRSGELEEREERQAPLAEKARAADRVVVNDGTLDRLEAELEDLWNGITKGTPRTTKPKRPRR